MAVNLGDVSTVAKSFPVVGSILGAAEGLLKALGVRGPTTHFGYDEVEPKAAAWATQILNEYSKHYSDAELTALANPVQSALLASMSQHWGLSANMSLVIAQDVQNPSKQGVTGKWILWLFFHHFYLWIGTNIDAAHPETMTSSMLELFPPIFITTLSQAGLDPTKLQEKIVGLGTVAAVPAGAAVDLFSIRNILIVVGVIVVVVVLVRVSK